MYVHPRLFQQQFFSSAASIPSAFLSWHSAFPTSTCQHISASSPSGDDAAPSFHLSFSELSPAPVIEPSSLGSLSNYDARLSSVRHLLFLVNAPSSTYRHSCQTDLPAQRQTLNPTDRCRLVPRWHVRLKDLARG
ncbi:hypothetical protein FPOAC2_05139 [Fusarium poae]